MARIRTIKPEFWEDEKIAKLNFTCRLFYIGCWNFADDYGFLRGNPELLKSQIFPYDANIKTVEIKKWLNVLVEMGMIYPYPHNMEHFYWIRTFKKHQKIDKRYDKSFIGKDIVEDVICNLTEEHITQKKYHGGNTAGTRRRIRIRKWKVKGKGVGV